MLWEVRNWITKGWNLTTQKKGGMVDEIIKEVRISDDKYASTNLYLAWEDNEVLSNEERSFIAALLWLYTWQQEVGQTYWQLLVS